VVGDWLATPMYFSQHDPEMTVQLLRAAGFDVVSTNSETQLEGERPVEYVWFLARHQADNCSPG
jgi:hypothetical protein